MPIMLQCPTCMKSGKVDAKPGDAVRCPSCKFRFFVPPQAIVPASEPAPPAQPPAGRPDAAPGSIAAGSPTPWASGGVPAVPHAVPPELAPSGGVRAGVLAAVISGGVLLLALTVGLIWWAVTAEDPAGEQRVARAAPPETPATKSQQPALRPADPPKGPQQSLPPNKGEPRAPEPAPRDNPKNPANPPPQAGGEKEGPPPIEKKAAPPALPQAKTPDRQEGPPALKSVREQRSEENLMLPLDAVAPIKRLKEIQVVRIKGKAKFTGARNVNDLVITWESIRSIKNEEQIQSERQTLLFLEDRGWSVKRGRGKPLTGETLGFYKVFNYGLVVSNLIPLTQGGFETTSTGGALIDGRECFGVSLRRPGYPDLTMLFDKQTRLLTKVEFEGRFLDQNNRVIGKVTRVEWRFSDYKTIDGVKHWTRVEQWRDGRKYADVELSEVQFYNKVDASIFRVPELEAEIAKFYEDRKRFDETVVTFAQSIQRKDPLAAKAALQTLTGLRPDDPGHGKREKELQALEDVVLAKVLVDVEALFKNEDYAKAHRAATEGLRIRSSDPKLTPLATAARRLTLLSEYIALANNKQSSGDVDGVLETLGKVAEVLRDADPETNESKLVRQRFPEFAVKSLDYIHNKATEKKVEALQLLAKNDYVNAVRSGTAAKELFSRAKTILDAVADRVPGSGEKAARLELEVKGVQAAVTRATGFVDLADGRRALDAGYKVLAGAKDESAAFYEARAHLRTAEATLAKAAAAPETGAEADLRKAREGLRTVAGLIVPFDLDLTTPQDVTRWGKGWVTASRGDRTWLQTDLPKGVLLTPELRFPSTFLLKVDVALVNRSKQLVGRSWKLYPDLITLMLVPRDGQEALKVSLGRDVATKVSLSDVACVKVNDKVFTLRNAERNGGQLALSIKKDKGVFQVMVDDREITRLTLGSEFAKVAVFVNNGLDRSQNPFVYPAVSRVSLTALPPAVGKGGR
jgi:hypothetical protein